MPKVGEKYWWRDVNNKWHLHKKGMPVTAPKGSQTRTSAPSDKERSGAQTLIGGAGTRQPSGGQGKAKTKLQAKIEANRTNVASQVKATPSAAGQDAPPLPDSGTVPPKTVDTTVTPPTSKGDGKKQTAPQKKPALSKRRKGVNYREKFNPKKTYESAKGKLYRNKEGDVIGQYNYTHKQGKPIATRMPNTTKPNAAWTGGQQGSTGAQKPPKPAGSYGTAGGRPPVRTPAGAVSGPAAGSQPGRGPGYRKDARKQPLYTSAARALSKRKRGMRP